MLTLTPSSDVGRLPLVIAFAHVSVTGERLVPVIVIQEPEAMPG
jgi:hypothetical protein